MSLSKPIQLRLQVNGLTFAAQEWGNPDGEPVLALHGWLDNSASFHALAPQLTGVRLVAIDMAGHGESAHRSGFTPYGIWEDVAEVFGVAAELGWERFTLMGHSRGAVIASLAAGTFPERIKRLILLDGFSPEPIAPEKAPEQLANSILEHWSKGPSPHYGSLEAMIKTRQTGFWPLTRASAEALVERGVRRDTEGYCWSSDPRLTLASPMKLTAAQVSAFLQRISAPTRLLLAEEGLNKAYQRVASLIAELPVFEVEVLPGGHHFHLEGSVEQVAERVNQFLRSSLRGSTATDPTGGQGDRSE